MSYSVCYRGRYRIVAYLHSVVENFELMGYRSLRVTNKTYIAKAKKPIDLWSKQLTSLPNYQPPKNFSAGFLKIKSTKYSIFRSGKIVINGLGPLTNKFVNLTGIEIERPKLQHCSAKISLTARLILEKLSEVVDSPRSWPGHLPGLIFKLGDVSVTAHENGTVIFFGCENEEDAKYTSRRLVKLINQHEAFVCNHCYMAGAV